MKAPLEQLRALGRENTYFFFSFTFFLLAGGAGLLTSQTGDLVFFFSDHRSVAGDLFFRYVTTLGEGLFFVLGVIALCFIRYRYAVILPFLGLAVSIVTQSAKAFFAHPRPYAYLTEVQMLDRLVPVAGVPLHGGWNSFPSGHTMAGFALFAFLALCLPRKKGAGLLFFLLALLVGISRVYLGQHFFKDIYLGSILGVLLALIFYVLAERLPARRWPWLDKRLRLRA